MSFKLLLNSSTCHGIIQAISNLAIILTLCVWCGVCVCVCVCVSVRSSILSSPPPPPPTVSVFVFVFVVCMCGFVLSVCLGTCIDLGLVPRMILWLTFVVC